MGKEDTVKEKKKKISKESPFSCAPEE